MTKHEPILRAFARENSIDRGQTNRLRAACPLGVFSYVPHEPKVAAIAGRTLTGRAHVAVSRDESRNLASYLLQDYLDCTTAPHYNGSLTYGRPLKPHGWQPWTNVAFVRMAFDTVSAHAPGSPVQ